MFKRVRAFIRGEAASGSVEVARAPQWEKGATRLGWSGDCYSRSIGKTGPLSKGYTPRQPKNWKSGMRGMKVINMVNSERNLKRPYEMGSHRLTEEIAFLAILQISLTDAPIILEGAIEGYHVRRIYVDGTSGKLWGNQERVKSCCWSFFIVKCHSPYNVIIRRTGMRSLGAVGSTIHSMIKFPTNNGFAMMRTSKEALWECKQIERMQSSWKEMQWCQHREHMSRIREQTILRARNVPNQRPKKELMITKETRKEDTMKEKVTIHNDPTLQRMMDKVLEGQKGRNVEVYLEEVVVKSKTKESLIEDVKEIAQAPKGDRNLLHSDRKGSASIGSHDEVLKDNLSNAQSQGGNQRPHGRDTETFRYQKTIGKMGVEEHLRYLFRPDVLKELYSSMGSGVENISYLIRPKEGSRGGSGAKTLRTEEKVPHMPDKNNEDASRGRLYLIMSPSLVFSFSSFSYFLAMSKNDMKNRVSTLSKSDIEDLVKTSRIPLDLYPCLHDYTFTMDRLPNDAIGIYFEFLWFSGVCIPFLTFLLFVLKYYKVHILQLVSVEYGGYLYGRWSFKPEEVEEQFFLINRKAILDHFTWRHSHSCISNDLLVDGYERNDVERLHVHLIRLCEMREEGDAKIVEEPRHLSELLLERVPSYTNAPTAEDALIPLPTLDEVVVAQPDPYLARKSKEAGSSAPKLGQAKGLNEADITGFCMKLEDSMERDEGTSIRVSLVLTPRLGKRLGPSFSMAIVSIFGPAHVWTLAPASTSGHSLDFGGSSTGGFVGKSRAEDMRRQMDPLAHIKLMTCYLFYHICYSYNEDFITMMSNEHKPLKFMLKP
nr:hypothetical protein [Tanacetum cinerariifolium]